MNDPSLQCEALADMLNGFDINGNTSTPAMEISQQMDRRVEELTTEALIERNKSWEGLQTKADQQKSRSFIYGLSIGAIICPFCRTNYLQSNGHLLGCMSCGSRVETRLSIDEITRRMREVIQKHAMSGCEDQFPQISVLQSKLTVYCDTCPLVYMAL